MVSLGEEAVEDLASPALTTKYEIMPKSQVKLWMSTWKKIIIFKEDMVGFF